MKKHFFTPLFSFLSALALCFLCTGSAYADAIPISSPLSPAGEAPQTGSRSAVVIDGSTGTLLYSADGNVSIPPASLTKLMTIHLVLNEIKAGRASPDDIVELPPESWAVNQSPRSSLMFLAEGQRVTLGELLLGMAVSSGNDAAVALALHFAPSVEAFTSLMNAEAGRLFLSSTKFTEPSGISADNRTTALDFARFCRVYLTEHPEAPGLLHTVKEFAYPLAVNTPNSRPGTILQYNHNTLLHIEGIEGLKTGHIDEAGYNIALSVKRGPTRIIVVILGAETEELRDADGEALIEWGFANYRTMSLSPEFIPQAYIWKGKERYVQLKPGGSMELTVSKQRGSVLEIDIQVKEDLEAPLPSGYEAGTFTARDEKGELLRVPLVLTTDMEEGGFFRRLFDSIRLFFKNLFSNG